MIEGSKQRSKKIEYVTNLQQRLYMKLLSSLTEDWMGLEFTMPQLKVLLCLYIDGPLRMGDLAVALNVSTPTATGIVDRLITRGVIARSHDTKDRRVVTCQLTPEGEGHVSVLWLARREVFQEIFGSLSEHELDVVANAAEVVIEAAARRNAKTPTRTPTNVANPPGTAPSNGGSATQC